MSFEVGTGSDRQSGCTTCPPIGSVGAVLNVVSADEIHVVFDCEAPDALWSVQPGLLAYEFEIECEWANSLELT